MLSRDAFFACRRELLALTMLTGVGLVACPSEVEEGSPTPTESTPTLLPVTPTLEPATPTLEPATPTLEPATPTLEPSITPTETPSTPTEVPPTPTATPATPTAPPALGGVVLNEIKCESSGDWIELYSLDPNQILNLEGYVLSDKPEDPTHLFTLAAGTQIDPLGFLVLVEEETEGDGGLTFGLKCGEESVHLFSPDGTEVDVIALPALTAGATYGRVPDGSGSWQETTPSQGSANGAVAIKTVSSWSLKGLWQWLWS